MFKVIIAGGRDFKDQDLLVSKCAYYLNDKVEVQIVSGGAKGADKMAKLFAAAFDLSYKEFLADWDEHGKAAGPIRNKEMAKYADALIAFWDGKSPGTKNMIETAEKQGLQVKIVRYETN